MNQTPPPDDDIRLSESEIRARSQDLRRQYIKSEERGVTGAVGSVVIGGFEAFVKRILLLLRLPLILLSAVLGFLLLNGRDGVSFIVALIAAVIAGIIGAALLGGIVRFIDARAYRRDVG